MRPAVSDEVWQQLHPAAGRLSRRAATRVSIAVVLALAVVAASTALWQSGTVVPQVSWVLWGIKSTEPPSDVVGIDAEIENDGLAPVTIAGVGRSGPGLDLIRIEGRLPMRIKPTAGARFILFYRITDCGRVPVGSWPVAVRVDRPWGIQTANPRSLAGDFPLQRSVTGPWCRSAR